MKSIFAVPWIEIEYGWGEKPEGFRIYETLEECIKDTKLKSETGNYASGSGYFGPERPLRYFEVPDDFSRPLPKFMDDLKFKSDVVYIE